MLDTFAYGATNQRILCVDDDPDLLSLLCQKLSAAGYAVWTAHTGKEALEIMQRRGLPHLALVDIKMPEMNGLELCRAIQRFSDLPVILLTAVGEDEMVVKGLELYAEDYVVKPFSPEQLVARIRRVLRRMDDYSYTLESPAQIDDRLSIDFVNQRAIVDGEAVTLTPIETRLLYILLRNAGQTVTTNFLLRRVWPLNDTDHGDELRVYIYRLRRKLEAQPDTPRYIVNQRREGYSFTVPPRLGSIPPTCPERSIER